MSLRPLLTRMPSSHRSCSPLHSLFGAEYTKKNAATLNELRRFLYV